LGWLVFRAYVAGLVFARPLPYQELPLIRFPQADVFEWTVADGLQRFDPKA